MLIRKTSILEEVQNEFNTMFPYLKLEFYSKAHKTGEGSKAKELLPNNLSIADAGDNPHKGEIKLLNEMQVSELEQQFESVFGLHVQVWRKSGTIWLQTITTDEWTLKEQNYKGKLSLKGQEI